jgi:hypothetical protein
VKQRSTSNHGRSIALLLALSTAHACGGDGGGAAGGPPVTVLGPATGAGTGGVTAAAGSAGTTPATGGMPGSSTTAGMGSPPISGTGGASGTSASGAGGSTGASAGGQGGAAGAEPPDSGKFSFFVTSLEAIKRLSGSEDGFGGDLGGLEGADEICQTIATEVGAADKTWRAFLSVVRGPNGQPVNAIDRIGEGPWYDRNDRLVAMDKAGLLAGDRPAGDPLSVDDLPDEHGVGITAVGDAHDTLTGSDKMGRVSSTDPLDTCMDWTSADGPSTKGRQIMIGHSFPRGAGSFPGGPPGGQPFPGFGGSFGGFGGAHWISDHATAGCAPGINTSTMMDFNSDCIGCLGGFGGLYCFATSSGQ